MTRRSRHVGTTLIGAALVLTTMLCCPQVTFAADACTVPKKLGVVFLVDDSGSMETSDPTRLRQAATEIGLDSVPDGGLVAAGSFDTSARSFFDATEIGPANRSALKDNLFFLASGQTDYELGFEQAQGQLANMTAADKRAVVFLSDGQPTSSYSADRQIGAAGVPIFTLGFGDASASELAGIAARSGGQSFDISSPGEAQSAFAQIVARLTCDAQATTITFDLAPSESRSVPFDIAPTDREFRSIAAWAHGAVTVRLQRPDGTQMGPGALRAGESFDTGDTYATGRGLNPAAGGWKVVLTAAADNVDSVAVSIDVYRRSYAIVPDKPVLTAPASPATVAWGTPVTFSWTPARGATSYELLIDGVPVATGLTANSVALPVKISPLPHSWSVRARNTFGATDADPAALTVQPRGDVVMVGGLLEHYGRHGAATGASCAGYEDFTKICDRLAQAGLRTWLIGERPGGAADDEIDAKGSVDRNADALVKFIKKWLPLGARPILLGHSMGGLISRDVVSRGKPAVSGLITLGTPYDGSFWADAVIDGASLACHEIIHLAQCIQVYAASQAIQTVVGRSALQDMRRVHRVAENSRLAVPAVPVWALAGTGLSQPVANWRGAINYAWPNDVAVGVSSALGLHGHLGSIPDTQRRQVQAWHYRVLEVLGLKLSLAGTHEDDSEFDDPEVLNWVSTAVTTPSVAGRATRSLRAQGATVAKAKAKAKRSAPFRSTARAYTTGTVGSRVPPSTALVFSTEPFALRCGTVTMPATVIAEDLVVADATLVGCRSPRAVRSAKGALFRTSDPAHVRVVATRNARGVRLVITAHRKLSGARATLAGRRRALHDRSRSAERIVALVRVKHNRTAKVSVRAGGRLYTAVVGT